MAKHRFFKVGIHYIQVVAQLTSQRKLICADSNNITGKTDSFFLSAFLIDLEAYQIHQSRQSSPEKLGENRMNEGVAWFPKILSFYSKYLVDCILL
jgi:hypothetical protein